MNSVTTGAMLLLLGALYAAFFLIECVDPPRKRTAPLFRRLMINFLASGAVLATVILTVRPATQGALQWPEAADFGLIRLLALPALAEYTLTFLLLDLTFYYWHVANHRIPLLWRMHVVHHIDPDLDVSTGFRLPHWRPCCSTSSNSSCRR